MIFKGPFQPKQFYDSMSLLYFLSFLFPVLLSNVCRLFRLFGSFTSQSRQNFMHSFIFYFPSSPNLSLTLSFQIFFLSSPEEPLLVGNSHHSSSWRTTTHIHASLSSILHFIFIRFVHQISCKHCVLQVFLNVLKYIAQTSVSITSAC